MDAKLWLRIGDAADYEEHGDDFAAAALVLVECNVKTPLHWRGMGFTTGGYEGNNYVSCFWGDDDAQPIRDLTKKEISKLSSELDREWKWLNDRVAKRRAEKR